MPRRFWNYADELSELETGRNFTYSSDENGNPIAVNEDGLTAREVLEQYQEKANRLNAISGVYQRADRIITGQDITVEVVDSKVQETPASNTGKTIRFNADLVPDLEGDSIIALHGLNYHEVSHVLYSPRAGSDLARYVRDNEFKRAFFMLEDTRAEAMLVTKYPITRLFLEASTMEYLSSDGEIGALFPLITGRKYLPIELRQAVADKAVELLGRDTARTIQGIVHAYRNLVFPRDFDKAKDLIERFARIVGVDKEAPTQKPWDIVEDFLKEGRPANTAEQDKLQGRERYKGEPSESLDGDGNNNNKGFGEGGAKDSQYDGEDTYFDEKNKAIADLITKRMSEIRQDKFVKREVSDTRKAILNSDEMRLSMRNTSFVDKSITPSSQVIARKFSQELQQLVLDQDPAWEIERPYGKLNIKRTMTPDINNIGRVFDRWDIGNDNTEVEAVILLDNSSSMGSLMRQTCETAWILKRAIESIQGSVTIYSFNHESKLLADNSERANPNNYRYVPASGNTNPIRGLIEAERVFDTTRKPIKLLFVVTDGEWSMETECNNIISSMKDKGVYTSLIFLDDYEHYKKMLHDYRTMKPDDYETVEQYDYMKNSLSERIKSKHHGVHLFQAVSTPTDMLKVARTIVKELVAHERVA